MSGGSKKHSFPVLLSCMVLIVLCTLFLSRGDTEEKSGGSLFHVKGLLEAINRQSLAIVADDSLNITIDTADEGDVIFRSSEGYYRYGPSIIEYEDGSYDAWFSAPGNSSTQWDWITYRHSDDGENWSKEKVVLKPTAGSADQCSVCDPGVICFDGYYYLAYTSTDDYRHKGTNNSAFVARAKKPQGPYEKWNGNGWGGNPQPIIEYEDDPRGWGIGEISFVVLEKDIYIYYTYFNTEGGETRLAKAEVGENWPATIEEKDTVIARSNQDSLDFFYADDYKMFMAFTIEDRMSDSSELAVYISGNGQHFERCDSTKKFIEDYAHNLGIAKSPDGHQTTDKEVLIGYAYGKRWGRWNTRFQHITITNPTTYKVVSKGGQS